MNRRTFLISTAALPLLHAIPEDAPYKTGKGWKALFNGRDVSGWHGADTETIKGGSEWMTVRSVRLDNVIPKLLGSKRGRVRSCSMVRRRRPSTSCPMKSSATASYMSNS